MYTTEKHFKTRALVFILIIIVFIVFGNIIAQESAPVSELEGRRIRRSCLGNPLYLPYAFIGIPLIVSSGIIDVIILAIFKKLTWSKTCINIMLIVFSVVLGFSLIGS